MNEQFIYIFNTYILYYFLVISVCYTILLIASIPDVLKRFKELLFGEVFPIAKSAGTIPVTVIIPAYNEQENILNCVKSALNSTYKNLKVIVVSDGSTDATIDRLNKRYKLQPQPAMFPEYIKTAEVKQLYVSATHPQLSVIEKAHSGTGDTLNVGLNATQTPLFLTLDADSMLEPDTIPRLAYCMLNEPHTIAVGGGVYLLNDCEVVNGEVVTPKFPNRYVSRLQACEYMRSFIFGRSGWNAFKGSLSYSGTCSLFEHAAALEVGGFDINNPAQDAEIIVNMHANMRAKKHPYNILFTPVAFSWTKVPDSFKSYAHQRIQWQWGLMRSILLHFKMFFNPRYGITGMFAYPFYLLVETLGPLVELTTYILIIISLFLGVFDAKSALIFFLLSAGFSSFLTVATMLINIVTFNKYRKISDIMRMFFYSIIEMFGFRQYSITIRTIGAIKYLFVGFRKKHIKG